jgi:hypothetical protein
MGRPVARLQTNFYDLSQEYHSISFIFPFRGVESCKFGSKPVKNLEQTNDWLVLVSYKQTLQQYSARTSHVVGLFSEHRISFSEYSEVKLTRSSTQVGPFWLDVACHAQCRGCVELIDQGINVGTDHWFFNPVDLVGRTFTRSLAGV